MEIKLEKTDNIIKLSEVSIIGEHGLYTTIDMALDTGTTTTSILPTVAKRLGYNPKKIKNDDDIAVLDYRKPVKYIVVPTVKIQGTLSAQNMRINILEHKKLYELGIEGLLGLDFVKQFNININYNSRILEIFS